MVVKKDVEAVVNTIEDIDSEIGKLTQEKEKLTKENHVGLLEYDLNTIKKVYATLKHLKTEVAIESIEEELVLDNLEIVIERIEEEIPV